MLKTSRISFVQVLDGLMLASTSNLLLVIDMWGHKHKAMVLSPQSSPAFPGLTVGSISKPSASRDVALLDADPCRICSKRKAVKEPIASLSKISHKGIYQVGFLSSTVDNSDKCTVYET